MKWLKVAEGLLLKGPNLKVKTFYTSLWEAAKRLLVTTQSRILITHWHRARHYPITQDSSHDYYDELKHISSQNGTSLIFHFGNYHHILDLGSRKHIIYVMQKIKLVWLFGNNVTQCDDVQFWPFSRFPTFSE